MHSDAGTPVNGWRSFAIDSERSRSFAAALDALRDRVESELGPRDVAHVVRMRRLSTRFERAGRVLIHVAFDPVTFAAGVVLLWLHKQLEATEIGHPALHGSYDALAGAEAFRSKTFDWRTPIDEPTWRYVHNVRHHGNTNVAGRDPDIHFGPIRLNARTPWSPIHILQVPITAFAAMNFTAAINLEYTGVSDLLIGNGSASRFDFIRERSIGSARESVSKLLRKWVPYYGVEYGFYPALAGPFFAKVALGNWLSETMRDVYSAASIFCGHVGEETVDYPEEAKPRGRGEWYAMQVAATNDFEVPLPISILCGALDRQIEHHLFPRLPPNRLREIAPEVQAICEAHGVPYRSESWGRTLANVVRRLVRLSLPDRTPDQSSVA